MSSSLDVSMERIHKEILELHAKEEAARSGSNDEQADDSTSPSTGTRRLHHPVAQRQAMSDDSQELFQAVLESFRNEPPAGAAAAVDRGITGTPPEGHHV